MNIHVKLLPEVQRQYEQMSEALQDSIKEALLALAQKSFNSYKYRPDDLDVVSSVAHLEIRVDDLSTWYAIGTNYENYVLSIEYLQETTALEALNLRIHSLEEIKKLHIIKGRKMLGADNGNIYPFDLFMTAVYNRSIALIDGFIKMITDNFTCAVPLLRLQIDNVLRVHAASLVSVNIHDFAIEVMSGKQIKKMKDRNNPKETLTDAYLVKHFSRIEPRIQDLYVQTSGYIHLSEKHIFNSVKVTKGNDAIISSFISGRDIYISDTTRVDAITAMIVITEKLFWLFDSWTFVKNNPAIAAEAWAKGEVTLAINS